MARLASIVRWLGGLAAFAAATVWTLQAVRAWWATQPVQDSEFGLRITPLRPAERAEALAAEREAAERAVIVG